MVRELKCLLQMLTSRVQFAAINLRDRQHRKIRELHARQLMLARFVDAAHEVVACFSNVASLIPRITQAAVGTGDVCKRVRLTCVLERLLVCLQTRINAAQRKAEVAVQRRDTRERTVIL
jgi:hypothetical protein